MIRALIVDDEPLSRRAVRQLCARHADVSIVAECRNGVEAAVVLRHAVIDVVFLDVRMPGLTGLDLAGRYMGRGAPLVVFVSAYDEYALPAFDTEAVDYVTKPLDPVRFARALDRVRARLRAAPERTSRTAAEVEYVQDIVARVGDRDVLLPVESIEYIAADDVYAAVHSQEGVHLVRESLNDLERRLDPALFVRCHRSFIAHVVYVIGVQRAADGRRALMMRSGAVVPVSRRRRESIRSVLRRRSGSAGLDQASVSQVEDDTDAPGRAHRAAK